MSSINKRRTCPNAATVREDLARTRLLEALRDHLFSPDAVNYARKKLAQAFGEQSRRRNVALDEHTKRLARTEQRVRGLVLRASGHRDRRDRTIVITGIGHRDRADRPS